MTGFDTPAKDDLERALSGLAQDKFYELQIAIRAQRGKDIARNMLQSSGHAMEVTNQIDAHFRNFLVLALERAVSFVGPLGSAKEIAALTAPVLEQFRDSALEQIPDAVGMRAQLVARHRPEFNTRIASALRDFEIGQIDGKPFNQASRKAIPLHQVNDTDYVDEARLQQLRAIDHPDFDLRRLIKVCEELNSNWRLGCYFAVPALVRTIMDHIPPVFGGKNFGFVKSNYGDRTFKGHMEHLDESLRMIADASLHRHIRQSDTLPTASQVNFSPDLEVLLGEVVAKLARR